MATPEPPPSTSTPEVSAPPESLPSPAVVSEEPTAALAPTTTSTGPSLEINLLLISGARHPYRLDEKYLSSRNVTAQNASGDFDPREISGYQLKELIWKDWRQEWEPKPASPSSIRLIIMGRMIEDKSSLKDFPFNPQHGNVVHLSVKPLEIPDDDEAGGKGSGKHGALRQRGDGEDRGAGCRCVIL